MLYETLNQLNIFFYIFIIGFCSGLLFLIRDILLFLFPKKAFWRIFFDFLIVFCLFLALFAGILLLNYGEFRFYLLTGFVFGLAVFNLFLSKPLAKFGLFCYNFINGKFKQRTIERRK